MVSIVTSNHPHHGCDESVAGGNDFPPSPSLTSHHGGEREGGREGRRERGSDGGMGGTGVTISPLLSSLNPAFMEVTATGV